MSARVSFASSCHRPGNAFGRLALASLLLALGCDRRGAEPTGPGGGGSALSSEAAGVRLVDLDGHEVDPFRPGSARWQVFIFVSVDCPISNRYAPEVRRLCTNYVQRGVQFWLVHPSADESAEIIRKHTIDYQYSCGALRDPKHLFAGKAGVRVTPEAALFRNDGTLWYRGRIDNRFADFGKERPAATEHDLEQAIDAALQSRPAPHPVTTAIGCYISD